MAPVRRWRAASGSPEAGAHVPEPLQVLVVDDNVDAAEITSELLEAQGHAVRIAHDAAAALAAVDELAPDVALVDIGLPGVDGYELARQLRQRIAAIRLVAITGYGQPGDRQRSREAGFAAHLVKPVSIEELEAVVHGAAVSAQRSRSSDHGR